MSNTSGKKLSTGIAGLDELFYGGIHTHEHESGSNQDGILMLARGQHGVNKIHLAMQICEGLAEAVDTSPIEQQITRIIKQNTQITTYYREFADKAKKATIIANAFTEIIKKNKDANDKKVWEDRKKKFEKKHDEWFNEIAPRLSSIDTKTGHSSEVSGKKSGDFIEGYHKLLLDIHGRYNLRNQRRAIKVLNKIYSPKQQEVVYISINKNSILLKNSYYDYYIQRLIKNIREAPKITNKDKDGNNTINNKVYAKLIRSIVSLHSMPWVASKEYSVTGENKYDYKFPSITPTSDRSDDNLRSGIIKNDCPQETEDFFLPEHR
ncbi:MAG: hypothetical protein IJ785_06400 [Bacteroidales bacterium]|nr:hypothetical protein [Bacteroidales bacterium]